MDLAHCTTLLIDLTVGEHLRILGEGEGICAKVAFAIMASDISEMKHSRAEVTIQSVYRNSCTAYRLVTNLVT